MKIPLGGAERLACQRTKPSTHVPRRRSFGYYASGHYPGATCKTLSFQKTSHALLRLVVEVPVELAQKLRRVVKAGGYADVHEFVRTAVQNQVELESAGELSDALREGPWLGASGQRRTLADGDLALEYKEVWSQLAPPTQSVATIDPPTPTRLPDAPLWGQYNRIFSVKLTVRRLLCQLHRVTAGQASTISDPERIASISLEPFSSETAVLARKVGFLLARSDVARGRPRGQKLSAGLPTSHEIAKSVDRFRAHFVGYSDKHGKLLGAPSHLRFVDISAEKSSRIGLTQSGMVFAILPNPILDGGVDALESLSAEERQFYLEHVHQALPREYQAMARVAAAISEGSNRPEAVSTEVAKLNPGWSPAQVNTMRSGLVSRMSELGLVDRARVGERGVAYLLTPGGVEFVKGSPELVGER